MTNLLESVNDWLAKPYQGSGQSAWRWFLFVCLILAIIGLWQIMLSHMLSELREIGE